MSQVDSPILDQVTLVEVWQTNLPRSLSESDHAEVQADEKDPNALRIHIQCAGHSDYSFDFLCTYLDSREVKVELVDVEQGHTAIDERSERIQQLVEDYVRHIHECAQGLHNVTHG